MNRIKYKHIGYIVLLGLFLRLIFILFFAEFYFNRPSIYEDNDIIAFTTYFKNLWTHHLYTMYLPWLVDYTEYA